MAVTVNDLFQFMRFLIRKNQNGGLTNDEFEMAFNSQQKSLQSDLLGRFQPQANNKAGKNTGLIQNQTVMTLLTPFTHGVVLPIIDGNAVKPYNFLFELGFRHNVYPITHVTHAQLAAVETDPIDPPSIADNTFYCVEYENFYNVRPSQLAVAYLDYIGTPRDVVWAYSIDVYGMRQYNPTGSIQPEWDDNSCVEIVKRSLTELGVSFKDGDFSNFGKSVIVTGD